MSLGAGAVTALSALILFALVDPTHADNGRLDGLTLAVRSGSGLQALSQKASYTSDIDALVQRPIFAMTTGNGAYAEKTFQLYGVSISSSRRAALISIDGAPPVWVRVGEVSGEVQLIDIGPSKARFDTPLGERSVNMSDPPPSASPAAPAGDKIE